MQWRRALVVEMRAKGMSQIEIAHELQVSEASISLDMQTKS
jgi:transcriptional regulator